MSARLVESTVDDFSRRVARHAKLPLGTEIRFYDTRKARWKRSDWCFKRHPVRESNLHVPADAETVRSYLECVARLISANLKARGFVIEMVDPRGNVVDALTSIGSVRALPPSREPTIDDDDSVELFSEMLTKGGWDEHMSVHEVGVMYRELTAMQPDLKTRLETQARIFRENLATINALLQGSRAAADSSPSAPAEN